MCPKRNKPAILSDIGEFGLIDFIKKTNKTDSDVKIGIGDDTAVVKTNAKKDILLTTDMLVEGVHFSKKMNPRDIGKKSVACSISDIAAMGGMPRFILISFGSKGNMKADFVKQLYSGMHQMAKKMGAVIVGGDIVESKDIVINIAVIGEVNPKHVVKRSGAKNKDLIFVTGKLGISFQSNKHLQFSPRMNESQYLVKNCKPNAMIDISDGLSSDLYHILGASKKGAASPFEAILSAPAKIPSIFPCFIRVAAILSQIKVVSIFALFNSHAVSLAPCKSGLVSQA